MGRRIPGPGPFRGVSESGVKAASLSATWALFGPPAT